MQTKSQLHTGIRAAVRKLLAWQRRCLAACIAGWLAGCCSHQHISTLLPPVVTHWHDSIHDMAAYMICAPAETQFSTTPTAYALAACLLLGMPEGRPQLAGLLAAGQ